MRSGIEEESRVRGRLLSNVTDGGKCQGFPWWQLPRRKVQQDLTATELEKGKCCLKERGFHYGTDSLR